MLKRIVIDAVRINYPFNFGFLGYLISQLIDIAEHHGVKTKKVVQKMIYGRTTTLKINKQELQVSVLKCGKSRWVSYRFRGIIDVDVFEAATVLLGDWSFRNAILTGHVKRLELAVDFSGLHTSQFVCHFKGMRKSNVISNEDSTGVSYYCGSRKGRSQMVVYDKAQEIRDKGGLPFCQHLLRTELRIQTRKKPLLEVIQEIWAADPFENFYIVDKEKALSLKTKIQDWPIFLTTCSLIGTANALREFPQHKKTFLEMLKTLSLPKLTPSILDFKNMLCGLFNGIGWQIYQEHASQEVS